MPFVNQPVIISESRDCVGPKKYFSAMSRYESKVKLIIVVIQLFAVLRFKTQKQKLGENKHCNWPEEITQGANVQKDR